MGNHMRHLLAIALAIALAGCGASAQEVNHTKGLEACTVELNGDSVLFGFVDNKTTWRLGTTPADWLRKFGYTVTDKTAGGLRTYDLLRGYATPFPEAWADLFPSGPQQGYGEEDHPSNVVVIQRQKKFVKINAVRPINAIKGVPRHGLLLFKKL